MLTRCALYPHLADIKLQAQVMFDRLVNQFFEKDGITEKLKAENQMIWIQQMNNIHNS